MSLGMFAVHPGISWENGAGLRAGIFADVTGEIATET